MKTSDFRAGIKSDILHIFSPVQWILAIWEGGSAATGYSDDYSDLDLAVIVDDEHVEDAFRLLEDYLDGRFGISHSVRIPEPAWHGHSQSFYFIDDAPPFFYVDFLVERKSSENRLTETDRHGEPRIWLDRGGFLTPGPSDPAEITEMCCRSYSLTAALLPLLITEIRKQIARGREIDAMSQYQRFIAGRLAGLLNLKYRREQYDFGIRYAGRAYPQSVNRRLKELLYVTSLDEMSSALDDAESWSYQLVDELRGTCS
jgi:hypothetical protein